MRYFRLVFLCVCLIQSSIINHRWAVVQTRILLSGSLKRFCFINLGEAEEQQCQLSEPIAKGEFWHSLEQALDLSKKRFRRREKQFGQQPVNG
jgi:hypothetical protein